jgi:hypothetical protein
MNGRHFGAPVSNACSVYTLKENLVEDPEACIVGALNAFLRELISF